MKNPFKNIYWIVFFYLLISISNSFGESLDFIDYQDDKATFVYEDKTKKLSFEDISKNDFQSKFQKVNLKNTIADIHYTYWMRFTVKNIYHKQLFIVLSHIYSKVDFYFPDDSGKWKMKQSGFLLPFDKRDYKYVPVIFDIPYREDSITCYLKLETQVPFGLVFEIRDSSIFKDDIAEEKFHFFSGGIILMVFIYSLVLFLIIKDVTYLYYCGYVFGVGAYALVHWGLLNRIINFHETSINYFFYSIPFSVATTFLLIYSRNFLKIKEFYPRLDKLIFYSVFLKILFVFISYIISNPFLLNPIFDSIFLLLPFIIGILLWKNNQKYVRYYVIGYACYFVGLFIHSSYYVLSLQIIFLKLSITDYSIIEMIFFSFALADRFKILKQEKEISQQEIIHFQKESIGLKEKMIEQLKANEMLKDKVNRELEDKIAERTAHIRKQAEEIERINALLIADNRVLETNNQSLKEKRILQKSVGFDEFKIMYPNDEACYKFLYELKWKDGYECRKCGSLKFSLGNAPYSCKCTRCNYIETVSVNTIFSNVRFPLLKAFYILMYVYGRNKINGEELAKQLELRRQTADNFVEKVKERIQGDKQKIQIKDGWISLIIDK